MLGFFSLWRIEYEKKEERVQIYKIYKKIFIVSSILFVFGMTITNSYLASSNIHKQKLEDDIHLLEADIDGLNMKKAELSSFQKLREVAYSNGYKYKTAATSFAVVGKNRNGD